MKVRISKKIDELFALAPPGSKKKKYNIISEEELDEMYSTAGNFGHIPVKIPGDKEHDGHVERSQKQGLRNVMNEENDAYTEAIKDIGFDNIEYINKGMYGSVYRGTWDNHDGVEHAIKVLPANGNGKHEAKVYRTISDIRSRIKSIAKHFPRVDMIRMDQKRNLILIVMELLEEDPNTKPVIQDIFGQGEVGLFRPDIALVDLDVNKSLGRRADMMIADPKTKEFIVNKLMQTVPTGKEYIKNILMASNFRNMKFPKSKWRNAVGKMTQNDPLINTLEVVFDDLKPDGKATIAFLAYFLNATVEAWEKEFDVEEMGYDALFSELYMSIEDFVYMYRSWTPIGISPEGSTGMHRGAPPEIKGAGYPGAESLLKAIKAVRATTGLAAYDMHDGNILVRPETKDLVIVDVGLFREASTRIKSPDKQVTVIEETIGDPKDFLRVIIEEIQKFNLT